MGNSEVGHLNLGAGAVVKQDLLRIDEAVEDGSFFDNETLKAACDTERLHLLGLVSAGGVHASMGHRKALIELAGRAEVPDVVLHAFTDGRDTNPDSGAGYLAEVEGWGGARIASVTGRYYAMDRDRRFDRTQLAYDAIVKGEAEFEAESGEAAVRAAYERDETDEFIKPTLVGEEGRVRAGDSIIFFNLLSRPGPSADPGARRRCRGAARHPHRVPGGMGLPGGLPARPARGDPGLVPGRRGDRPAPRGRDREVRARDLLLQRGRGGPVPRRGARARGLASRRPHLRQEAGDERRRGHRRLRRDLGGRGLRLRDHQLCQPRHGRTHRRDRGRRDGDRDGRHLPAPGGGGGRRNRAACAWSPPTTATPTTCSSQTAARTPRAAP